MFIKEFKIKNFRSLVKADIPLNNLSIFVGLNDVGKSNVLKALNLFFNGETDYGKPLDFNEDYSKYTPFRKKKANEIILELTISPPNNYKDSKEIKWTKIWRKTGLFKEEKIFTDRTNFPKNSKLISWLKNLKFTYVPAIRGTSYFQILLAKLHDTLAETIENDLRLAGDDFISKIKKNTEGMTIEISKRIGIKSQIRFPTNLQSLFKTLDFATSEGLHDISLSNRGDGVKTRHIPAILKFISDQLNVIKIKGSPNVSMIWGYEEPENNLEMLITYSLAEQFLDYSNDIQLLLTTHSPGFYSLKSKHNDIVNLFKVVKPKETEAEIIQLDPQHNLDSDMGVMPLISPYLEQKINEINELQTSLTIYRDELKKINSNILYVEGEDEVRVFTKIIKIENLSDKIIVTSEGMGCSGVKNKIMAWSWVAGTIGYKAFGVFDNDDSGKNELQKLKAEEQYINSEREKRVKALTYKVPSHLSNIKSKINQFPIELEEMYPVAFWKIAKSEDLLEERNITELSFFVNLDSTNQTITDKINLLNFSDDEKLYIFNKVPDQNKKKLSQLIVRDSNEDKLIALTEFFKNNIKPFLID